MDSNQLQNHLSIEDGKDTNELYKLDFIYGKFRETDLNNEKKTNLSSDFNFDIVKND